MMTPKWTPATRELAGCLGADDHGLRSLVETHESLRAEYKARIAELEAENARLRAIAPTTIKESMMSVSAEEQTARIERAYEALGEKERQQIDSLAETLMNGLRKRWEQRSRIHPGVGTSSKLMFGKVSALEVLAKLGIWMIGERLP